jgi:hydrogenase maturation protein HypF
VTTASSSEQRIRIRLRLRGRVQGVGFRPFVYRTAQELGLSGWVLNDAQGVLLEAEGAESAVKTFRERVVHGVPAPASVDDCVQEYCSPNFETEFVIIASQDSGSRLATILPEIATCADCRREIDDSSNRRYRYPFTNCTHCGPRFTIMRALPYDRPNTTMAHFTMCQDCRREYEDPNDRRFHAQPNACPVCGPQLSYVVLQPLLGVVNAAREVLARRDEALALAAGAIREGHIVAVQGLGGFHLVVDATNESAVCTLRQRKHRWEKPLAVMVQDIAQAREQVQTDAGVESLLLSPEAPIVLCRKLAQSSIAPSVAPDTPYLGVMVPSTPLHHLLLQQLRFPIVATSGNLSEEPICIDPEEAEQRLSGIADGWLVNDRPIERHMDDSVMQIVGNTPQFLRRARGYAPLPVAVPRSERVVLALGGHQKNTVAVAIEDRVFVSQHIGDLDSLETRQACERVVRDFLRLYAARPDVIAHDLHPDYASTQLAERLTSQGALLEGVPRVAVQHHHAHLAACLADAGHAGRALGVIWDGTGLGLDGTIWGGEFLLGDASGFQRVAALKPYPMLGGEAAARDSRHSALALLWSSIGPEAFDWEDIPCVAGTPRSERAIMLKLLQAKINCPMTSSMGRLFDAVAALCGLVTRLSFEGRAGMLLESLCGDLDVAPYPLPCSKVGSSGSPEATTPQYWLDPTPLIAQVVADVRGGVGRQVIATRFHAMLVTSVMEVASLVDAETVVLSGGCFQNRQLSEGSVTALQKKGIKVVIHRNLPPNDGGLSLGQALVARAASLSNSQSTQVSQ